MVGSYMQMPRNAEIRAEYSGRTYNEANAHTRSNGVATARQSEGLLALTDEPHLRAAS